MAQALVMLDNAIEVALQGELDHIHRILIANTKELNDFRTLKSLLRDALLKHPSGSCVDIPEFDIEKTIYFDEAFDRVAELHSGLRQAWRKRLTSSRGGHQDSLHSLRNNIVRNGSNREASGRYAEAIADTTFPFLQELFQRITGNTVPLPHLLMEQIYREVEVARLVLRDLQNEQKPQPYVIKTLQHHELWTYASQPSPRDDLDTIMVSGETDWEQYTERWKRALVKTWDDSLMVEVPCPVCGSETGDGPRVRAQVLLENDLLDNNCLIAEGFNCCVCGLHVSPRERFLARHFVGQIPEDIATAYLKYIGHL